MAVKLEGHESREKEVANYCEILAWPAYCTWVVQGWNVTDRAALAQMDMPEGEGCVEIPDRMIQFFRQEAHGVDHG
jgi:hypothetical protein